MGAAVGLFNPLCFKHTVSCLTLSADPSSQTSREICEENEFTVLYVQVRHRQARGARAAWKHSPRPHEKETDSKGKRCCSGRRRIVRFPSLLHTIIVYKGRGGLLAEVQRFWVIDQKVTRSHPSTAKLPILGPGTRPLILSASGTPQHASPSALTPVSQHAGIYVKKMSPLCCMCIWSNEGHLCQ